jgi:hypothetical protein
MTIDKKLYDHLWAKLILEMPSGKLSKYTHCYGKLPIEKILYPLVIKHGFLDCFPIHKSLFPFQPPFRSTISLLTMFDNTEGY